MKFTNQCYGQCYSNKQFTDILVDESDLIGNERVSQLYCSRKRKRLLNSFKKSTTLGVNPPVHRLTPLSWDINEQAHVFDGRLFSIKIQQPVRENVQAVAS